MPHNSSLAIDVLQEPHFVARDHEMTLLQQAFDRVTRGSGQVVFIEGESGCGKSRLITEFLATAPQSALVLRGIGSSQAVKHPFAMFQAPLRQLCEVAKSDPALWTVVSEKTAEWSAELCAVLPELAPLYGREARSDQRNEKFAQERTVRAMTLLFEALANLETPLVFLLEDCQWADEMALRLIVAWRCLLAQHDKLRALLLVSYRSDEVPVGHTLRKLSPDISIELQRMTESGLRAAIKSMASNLPEDVIQTVINLSGGSPLLASTVLRGMAESGMLMLREGRWHFSGSSSSDGFTGTNHAHIFLKRRIELLSDDLSKLLKVSAILGKEFDAEIAAHVAQIGPGAFEEAICRHIIISTDGERRYVFAHDKLREALLDLLSPDEYRFFCWRIASSMETLDQVRVFDLAFFYGSAGDYQRALPFAVEAAEEARTRGSLQLAKEQYLTAIKGISEGDTRLVYRVTKGLGEVLMLLGEYQAALAQFRTARSCAENDLEIVDVEARIGETIFKLGDTSAAGHALEEALSRLGYSTPRSESTAFFVVIWQLCIQCLHTLFPRFFLYKRSPQGTDKLLAQCRLLNQLTYVLWYDEGSLFKILAVHLRNLNLIETYKPTLELAHTYSCHGPAMTTTALFRRGIRYSKRALQIARDLENVWGQGQTQNFLGVTCLPASKLAECINHCYEGARMFERAGDLWELRVANCNVAYGLYRVGNLSAAHQWAEENYHEALRLHDTNMAAVCLSILSKSSFGDVPLAEITALREMLPQSALQQHAELSQAEALYWAAQQRYDRAVEILEKQWIRVMRKKLPQEYVLPVLPWLLTMRRLLALRQRTDGNLAEMRSNIKRALRLSRTALLLARLWRNNLPHVLRERALLLEMLGYHRAAVRSAKEALTTAAQLGFRFEYAQTAYALGQIRQPDLKKSIEWRDYGYKLLGELNAADVFFRIEDTSTTS